MSGRVLIDKLRRFVRTRFYAGHNDDANAEPGDETRPLSHVALTHMVADDRDVHVEDFRVTADLDDDALDRLAGRIEGAATDHCEGLPGVQRYRLAAYYQRSTAPNGAITFALRAVADDYTSAAVSEPANATGLLAQLMRSLDAKDRALLAVTTAQAAMIERQGQIIDQMQARQLEAIRLTEELLSERHTRELAAKEAHARIEHRGEVVRAVKALAPAIANRLAKKEVIPGTEQTAKAQLARSLLEGLKAEQAAAIADALGDDELRGEWLGILAVAQESPRLALHEPLRRLAAKLDRPRLMAIFAALTPLQQISVAELLDLRKQGAAPPTTH